MLLPLILHFFVLTSTSSGLFFGNCEGARGACKYECPPCPTAPPCPRPTVCDGAESCTHVGKICDGTQDEACGIVDSYGQISSLPAINARPVGAVGRTGQNAHSSYFASNVASYFSARPRQAIFSDVSSAPHFSVPHRTPDAPRPQLTPLASQQLPSVAYFSNPIPYIAFRAPLRVSQIEATPQIRPALPPQLQLFNDYPADAPPLPSKTFESEQSVPRVTQAEPLNTVYGEGPRGSVPTASESVNMAYEEESPKTLPMASGGAKKRARAHSTRMVDMVDEGKCSNEQLYNIMIDKIDGDPSSSKRAIQLEASAEIGGAFDVICSNGDFSYLANTRLFCEARKGNVICFAFLHSGLVT